MKVDRRDMESNLPRKGFKRNTSKDHIFFHHEYRGVETGIYTKISHSRKLRDVSGRLLALIRSQLKLVRTQEVVDLVECPMDGDTYNQLLIERGVLKIPG